MQEYKIFNDRFFDRARRYVKNEITQEEVDLFTTGQIRKVYGSFEELLLDNIEYYSRILRTILWLYENTLVSNGKIIIKTDKTRYKIPMTATKFYYICMIQPDFNRSEIIYGYPQISYAQGNTFQELWPELLKVGSFVFNVTYSVEHSNTKSYQVAFENDVTNSDYLSKVVVNSRFIYIDRAILSTDIASVVRMNETMFYNFDALKEHITDYTFVDSRPNGISYLGPGYSEELMFTPFGIRRDQTGSLEDTFPFDATLTSQLVYLNIRKNSIYQELDSIQNLKLICSSMIQNYRRKFKAVRLHYDNLGYSVITIQKFWNNFRVIELCFRNNSLLYKRQFNIGKLHKVVKYIVENGYFIYTINQIEDSIKIAQLDDPEAILNHFTEYINRTFVDSTLRLELMENETTRIIEHMKRYTLIDEQ